MNLFVGAGLSSFLFLSHSLFADWPTTTWALGFDIVGIALLSKAEKEEASSALAPLSSSVQLVLLGCLTVIGWLLYLHLQRPNMDRSKLQQEVALARVYRSDSSCDNAHLRQLARQAPLVDSQPPDPGDLAAPVCTVQWMRVVGKTLISSGTPCVILLDARQGRWTYCVFSSFELSWIRRRSIRVGDLIPTQSAFGQPSAFLRPGDDLVDALLYPHGEIIVTRDNPDRFFREHLWRCFWVVFAYLFLGVLILSKLLR